MKIPGTYQSVFDYCSIITYSKVSDSLQAEEALPEALWSPFINKGDLSVLFSETNVGKSILAMAPPINMNPIRF